MPVTEPVPQAQLAPELGDKLERLFDKLETAGLKAGPRDRINATALVLELATRWPVSESEAGKPRPFPIEDFRELRPHLAALLARSPDERRRFFQAFDQLTPPPPPPPPPPKPPKSFREHLVDAMPNTRQLMLPLAVVALLGLTAIAWQFWPKGPEDVAGLPSIDREIGTERPLPMENVAAPPPSSDNETLDRIAKAAERFEGAPTIGELAGELAKASPIAWKAESYALRLSELSGLPGNVPLALYGPDAKDGRVWARLALALQRIEQPGLEPTFAFLRDAANTQLAADTTPRPVYALASKIPSWLDTANLPPSKADLVAAVVKNYQEVAAAGQKAASLDIQTIDRALALSGPAFRQAAGATVPWLPSHTATGASVAPAWVRFLATFLPLTLVLIWCLNSRALRKAYLRRRPPDFPPLFTHLAANAAGMMVGNPGHFQRIAQRLATRSPRPTARLDIAGSVAATLRSGGKLLSPVFAVERQNPEYLILIERRSGLDQDAERMRALMRRAESSGLIHLTVFYYRFEPAWLEPEAGGPSVAIEQLQTLCPNHRLIVMGSGAEFLDPVSLKPLPSVEKLTHWPNRALLSPIPLAEWSREEFALAEAIRLPIGRATENGLKALPELLGLEGAELESLVPGKGDDLARPLGEELRIRPQRFLYSEPPSGMAVAEIVQTLRNYLDAPAFDWLCALAVYPAVQWDLTLYLGTSLPQDENAGSSGPRLYTEKRIAALTQLPWLRDGIMPNWLRVALIGELSETRKDGVRAKLEALLKAAHETGDAQHDEAIRFKIAHGAAKDRLPPGEIMEDEVLLDFLADGSLADFELPKTPWLDNNEMPDKLRKWLARWLGLPELAALAVAAAYGFAANTMTPAPEHGALVMGAWLPLVTLAAGFVLAFAVADLAPFYRGALAILYSLAAPALTFAGLMAGALVLLSGLVPASYESISNALLTNYIGLALLPVVAFLWLILARRIARGLGIPQRVRERSGPARATITVAQILIIGAIAEVTNTEVLRNAKLPSSQPLRSYALAPGIGLAIFVLALLAARVLPEDLPQPRRETRGRRRIVIGNLGRVGLALSPIAAAALIAGYVASSSLKIDKPMPGGLTAMAELPAGDTSLPGGADGGLLATGAADGTIRVYATQGGGAQPVRDIAGAGAAIASLALARERADNKSGPALLAAADANGKVQLIRADAKTGTDIETPAWLAALPASPSRTIVALGPGAAPLVATETEDGRVKLVSPGGETPVADSGPVTALIPVDDGRFAFATLDGFVQLAMAREGQAPAILPAPGSTPHLPGRARRLTYDANSRRLTAYGDDGTVLDIPASNAWLAGANTERRKMEEMRLGPAVKWKGGVPLPPPPQQFRVALVVGIDQYSSTGIRPLSMAARDATDIAAVLTSAGYATTLLLNQDATRENILKTWNTTVASVDPGGIALFFFSGYGAAIEGKSYLVPHDAQFATADQNSSIRSWLDLYSDFLTRFDQVRRTADTRGVFIVDSSRDNPFSKESEKSVTFGGNVPPRDAFVLYSAGAAQDALHTLGDSDKEPNSVFTRSLLKSIRANPTRTFSELAKETRMSVYDLTRKVGRVQTPAYYDQLTEELPFSAGLAEPNVSPSSEDDRSTATEPDSNIVATSPDGERTIAISSDGVPRLLDASTGSLRAVLTGHKGRVLKAAFSPDGALVVTASSDGTARIWDASTGQETQVLSGHVAGLSAASFSPDGKRVATASDDKTARLWETVSGQAIAVLMAHTDVVNAATFSPDGRRLVTASSDMTARIWDVETSNEIAVLKGHEGLVLDAEFSADGSRLLTVSSDSTARLWQPDTGLEIAVLRARFRPGPKRQASFSPDGKRIRTTAEDGSDLWWDADTGKAIGADARPFTQEGSETAAKKAASDENGAEKEQVGTKEPSVPEAQGRAGDSDASLKPFLQPDSDGKADPLEALKLPVLGFDKLSEAAAPEIRGVVEAEPAVRLYYDKENPAWYRTVTDYGDVAITIHADLRKWDDEAGKALEAAAKEENELKPDDVTVTTEQDAATGLEITVARYVIRKFNVPYSISLRCKPPAKGQCEDKARIASEIASLEVQGGVPTARQQEPATEGADQSAAKSGPKEASKIELPSDLWNELDQLTARAAGLGFSAPRTSLGPASEQPSLSELEAAIVDFIQQVSGSLPERAPAGAEGDRILEQANVLLERVRKQQSSGEPTKDTANADKTPREPDLNDPEIAAAGASPKMPPLEQLRSEYEQLFASAEIRPERSSAVRDYASRIVQNRARYEEVAKETGVPWFVVGLIHGMEASFNFNAHLHNGDSLKARTVRVPTGRPKIWNPPNDWQSSAIDALAYYRLDKERTWWLPETLYRLENLSGWRTRLLHNINTPYLWSFTNHYTKGKFVADNVWDPNAVSKQPGAAAILKVLVERGDVDFFLDPFFTGGERIVDPRRKSPDGRGVSPPAPPGEPDGASQ